MGREKLLKKIKSRGIAMLVLGIILVLIGGLLSLTILLVEIHPIVIAFLLFVLAGIALIYLGVDYLKGEKSSFIKKRSNIMELADDIENNLVFENKFIVISNKAIANKKDITRIAALNDVLAIYERIYRTNGIVTSHIVNLELRDGRSISINVYARKKDTKDNLVLTISKYCPNAKVGYSGEMLSYLREQRKEYKKNNK